VRRELSQRWVLSFADLTLLLLAFFVVLQAQTIDRLKMTAGICAAFGGKGETRNDQQTRAAAPMFEAGEAILKPAARIGFARLGAEARAKKLRVLVSSEGRDADTARLDAWELAAARTTAVARAIRAGGLAEDRIEVAIPPMRAQDRANGQMITVWAEAGR
jgi:flagellar motor protein MotB